MEFEIWIASFIGGGIWLMMIYSWLVQYIQNKELFAFFIFFCGGYGIGLLAEWMNRSLNQREEKRSKGK